MEKEAEVEQEVTKLKSALSFYEANHKQWKDTERRKTYATQSACRHRISVNEGGIHTHKH